MAKSLSHRIVVGLVATTVIAGICNYGWLYLKARSAAAALREHSLVEQATTVAAYLRIDGSGKVRLQLPAPLAEAYDNSQSGYRYAIRDVYGSIIFNSATSIAPLPPLNDREQAAYNYDPDGDGPLHVFGVAVKTTIGGRTFVTQVEQTAFESRFQMSSVTEEFITDGGWLQVPFLMALLAVTVFVVKRAMRPLRQISAMAESIDPRQAGVRLPVANVPEEIAPLVTAMNAALDRLQEGLDRQREFNANAAHQLRTPLAVLKANIDAMSDAKMSSALQHDVDLMSRIVSQLLVAARLETAPVSLNDKIDLNEVAGNVSAGLAPLAVSSGMLIEVIRVNEPVLVMGNVHLLSAALSNLVENAIAHTGAGTRVTIRVTADRGIEVTDTGPGIPAEWREKIFDRFWKGDRQSKGAGLGLPIVKRIMSTLHGAVSVSDNPAGGTTFRLSFAAKASG